MLRNKLHTSWFGLALVIVVAALGWHTRPASTSTVSNEITRSAQQDDYEIVASLPVGDGGVHYENVGVPEAEITGPASFRVAPDGTFIVADTSTNRILAVSQGGVVQSDTRVPAAAGIVDLAVGQNGEIFALDLGQQTIHHVTNKKSAQKIILPDSFRRDGLTGISIGKNGEPLLELKGGSRLARTNGDEARLQTVTGDQISLRPPDLIGPESEVSSGDLRIGEKRVSIRVTNFLAGLQLVGTDKNGGVFVSVLELISHPALQVDETIRHYDKDLNLLGVARVPVAERYTFTQRGVSVGEDGNVYAMIPRSYELDIVRLSFKQGLKPILPDGGLRNDERGVFRAHALHRSTLAPATACTRTRTQMTAAAAAYVSNQTYLNSRNLTGACAGRTAPRYLGTSAGNKTSVPYDWGGNDSVSAYNSFMSQGYQAGDILTCNNGCAESCSKGVDCSGFVSQVWGLSSKYSTTTLPNISTQLLDVRSLQMGDILNLYNSHVVIFNGMENGGIDAWESTVYGSQDRVVYGYVSWTRLSGYVPYRYNGVCNTGNASLTVTPTTILVTRGGTATYTVYAFTSDGFRGSVNLYALNLPGTVLAGTGFYPQTLNVTSDYTWFGSPLKIVTNSATPTGSRTITIEGRSGDRILRSYVQLTVR